jgi:hypothetical protein
VQTSGCRSIEGLDHFVGDAETVLVENQAMWDGWATHGNRIQKRATIS